MLSNAPNTIITYHKQHDTMGLIKKNGPQGIAKFLLLCQNDFQETLIKVIPIHDDK